MPYDLPFVRVVELSNESALELNKAIAAQLIVAFSEIQDLNPTGSKAHFMRLELDDLEEKFPDKHFSLHGEVEDMFFAFQFWKNNLWLELGAGGDAYRRFAHVRRYAAFIMQQGFRIGIAANEVAGLNEGLAWHWQEYKEWVGFIDQVSQLIAARSANTE